MTAAIPDPLSDLLSDRRRDERLPIAARGIAEDDHSADPAFIEVMASDVSEHGIQLHTNREELFIPYGLLALVFTPTGDGAAIQLKAQIAWVRRPSPASKEWSLGCVFVQTPVQDIRLLVNRARSAGSPASARVIGPAPS